MSKILVSGCLGAMGSTVVQAVRKENGCTLAGGFDLASSKQSDFPIFASPADCAGVDFDVVIDDHGSQKTEAVYQQDESEGKAYQDLDNLLQHHKYENAIRYVYDQKFELERGNYYQLGEWLVKRLQADKDIDPALLSNFVSNMDKYK